MRTVVIVAAHFVPSNLTAVHRSRLWVPHLPKYGWRPIVVTTDAAHYEEAIVPELAQLLPPKLEMVATRALPGQYTRPLVGDIGLRAFWWHYRALCGLAERGRMDFLHITIPSFYSALLGRLIHRRYGIPYGIDYIDPWVHTFPVPAVPFGRLKAWGSEQLARWLEPWAVRGASLITGVDAAYYEGVLERNPHLNGQAVTAAMPYGGAVRDHEVVRKSNRPLFLWDPNQASFNLLYAGAMLPKAYPVLKRVFSALQQLKREQAAVYHHLAFHFVGTGTSPGDPEGHTVQPLAKQFGVEEIVHEHPHRIPYLDVLSHLQAADGALIVGSTERHYTPSKTFQAVQAKCPIFALLHEESSATNIIRQSQAGTVVSFADGTLPSTEAIRAALIRFVTNPTYDPSQVEWSYFEQFSARETTRQLAEALDVAYEKAAGAT